MQLATLDNKELFNIGAVLNNDYSRISQDIKDKIQYYNMLDDNTRSKMVIFDFLSLSTDESVFILKEIYNHNSSTKVHASLLNKMYAIHSVLNHFKQDALNAYRTLN